MPETANELKGRKRAPSQAQRDKGKTAFLSGEAAESAVLRLYQSKGFKLVAQRWRGQCGEIDLILLNGPEVVFVEVKKARSFSQALQSLGARQIGRIFQAAEEFLGQMPDGQLSEARMDLAIVDGKGQIQILENALGEY